MSSPTARILLKHALPLVSTYGFTRQALSLAVLSLPKSHAQPLSETAVSALFGPGDEARRTLIQAWLEEGNNDMGGNVQRSVGAVLKQRLGWNEPVLQHLPEAFALLTSPSNAIPPLDPRPLLSHSASVADRACRISGEQLIGTQWYTRRVSLAAIYTAAELHQLTSPETANAFLDDLLSSSGAGEKTLDELAQFGHYVVRSWAGIFRSTGAL